jgi:hypothetical protein
MKVRDSNDCALDQPSPLLSLRKGEADLIRTWVARKLPCKQDVRRNGWPFFRPIKLTAKNFVKKKLAGDLVL